MRTNQQLGYIVWSYPRLRENTHYLAFVIQSGEYSALELSKRASKLINEFPNIINSLDDKTFQQLKNSAIEKLEKRPMSIAERSGKFKNLIFEFDADYDRDKKTIEALNSLKKQEAVESITLTVSDNTKKMVNFMMFAKQHEMEKGLKSSFKDLSEWKKTRKYN